MAHFCALDINDIVLRVEVIHNDIATDEAAGIAFMMSLYGAGNYVQTSYNSNIRGQYAGVGYKLNRVADRFISPQPFPSWSLNETTWKWEAPTPEPEGGNYRWDEVTLTWLEV